MARRVSAATAIVAGCAAPVCAVLFALGHIGLLVVVLLAIVLAAAMGWVAVTRRGATRVIGAALALAGLIGATVAFFVALSADRAVRDVVVIVLLLALAGVAARHALEAETVRAEEVPETVPAARPTHPVLLMNPKSGGGKVEQFGLVQEARRRGIDPVVLGPDDDFYEKAVDAIHRGADALGAAGGDGSQAVVATVALQHDLPYVCIPAGTRNHLALDLGVDRDDVVGSLDAFVDGRERRVDIGVAGDRVFVNNVSFGVYGEIVQSEEYRNTKVRTAANMLPDLLGPGGHAPELRFTGPDGRPRRTTDLVLVSNNPYNITRAGGFGTRPRLDSGTLGIVSIHVPDAARAAQLTAMQALGRIRDFPGYDEWTTERFELDADEPLAAGIDGEFVKVEPPVVVTIRPGALRVRLAPGAPGASPAARARRMDRPTFRALWSLAWHGSTTNGHSPSKRSAGPAS